MPTIYNFIKYTIESFSYRNQKRKIKVNQIGEEVQLSLLVDDIILYIKSLKDSTKKKLLELIKEFSEVEGYKMKTQNSAAFLYTKKELLEKQIKKTIPFSIALKD